MKAWEQRALRQEVHEEVRIPRIPAHHLERLGYRSSFGAPKGQIHDYRRTLPDGRCLHIRDHQTHMTVHWDHVDPAVDPVGHLIQDAPLWALGIGIGAWTLKNAMEN